MPASYLIIAFALVLHACAPAKDAEIVASVVIAELAQSQNALPSDISVDQVNLTARREALVEATQKIPGARYSQRVTYICAVTWTGGRWNVTSVRRKSP